MYVQTVRGSIYNTRLPKHPHSPIFQCLKRPQVLHLLTRYMESLTFHEYAMSTSIYASTSPCISAYISIATITPPRYNPYHFLFWSATLSTIIGIRIILVTVLDLVCFATFCLIILYCFYILLDSFVVSIWFASIFLKMLFDSRLVYLFLIRVTQFESYSNKD